MIGRLLQAADFERVLKSPSRSRSAHFALHHVAQPPLPPRKPAPKMISTDLSTAAAQACPQPVDDLLDRRWLGYVVPKRHARRAVTRNLLKRQIRHAFDRHAEHLPPGQWLVRLRCPFALTDFISARSDRLAHASRQELESLLARVLA
jgi:ribonuclease P protein component